MSFRIDHWDVLAGAGVLTVLAGLSWFSVPLTVAAVGGVAVAVGLWGSRGRVQRRKEQAEETEQ